MRFASLFKGFLLIARATARDVDKLSNPDVVADLGGRLSSGPNHRPWDISQSLNGFTFSHAKAISSASLDVSATHSSRLRRLRGYNARHSSLTALSHVNHPRTSHSPAYNASVTPVNVFGGYSTQYSVECVWDDAPVWLLFDTGSADTWTPSKSFTCVDMTGASIDPEICGFGPAPIEEFRYGEVDDVHIYVQYGSGETVSGPMGLSDVSCGGIDVLKQQVGLVNRTYWHGNNITTGILGLAYPSITSGFYGQVGEEAIWNAAPYVPWFTKATAQGLIAPMFSIALERNSTDGVLAWGGLPPSMDWQPGSRAATSLIIANIADVQQTAWEYSFYTIVPDGMRWGEMYDTTKYPFIVDTGTAMIYLPPPLTEIVAKSFEPPATYLYEWGAYYAPCDSVPPVFGVMIQGRTFYIRPDDLIFQDVVDPATGFCAVALTTGGMGPYILGDVFLQSVLAVFDVGAAEMRFYSRYYSEES